MSKKISELAENTSQADGDLLVLVDVSDSPDATEKITVANHHANVRTANGDFTTVAHSFASQVNSGMNLQAADNPNIVAAGVESCRFTIAGLRAGPSGSSSLPSVAGVGGPQSGLHFPSASVLGLTAGGTGAMLITSLLNNATGDQVAFDLTATVNKATSGNYTGLKLDVTETAAPGTADLLVDLRVSGATKLSIDNAGDFVVSGGQRMIVGPFTADGAAGVIAASQTNDDLRYSHTVTAAALGFIAPRAGSIMGLSAQISAAITGAGTSCTVKATVNGTEVGAALDLSFTQAGGEVKDWSTTTKDAVAFAAGDIIGVSYTTTAITNTPALVASIEIEM